MKTTVRILSFALVALLLVGMLAGCGKLSFNYVEETIEETNDGGEVVLVATLSYPLYGGGDAAGNINAVFSEHVEDFKTDALSYKEEAIVLKAEMPDLTHYAFDMKCEVVETAEDIISVKCTGYAFLGGAHGSNSEYGFIFDAKTGETVTAADLLGLDTDGVNALVRAELEAMIAAQPEMYYEDAAVYLDDALASMGYYAEGDELVFVIGEYMIAPYAAGLQYVRIPMTTAGE